MEKLGAEFLKGQKWFLQTLTSEHLLYDPIITQDTYQKFRWQALDILTPKQNNSKSCGSVNVDGVVNESFYCVRLWLFGSRKPALMWFWL